MRKLSLFLILGIYICSLIIFLYNWNSLPNFYEPNLFPSMKHLFGTDSLGRDYFQRVMIGTQISFFVGLSGGILTLSLGLLMGFFLATAQGTKSLLFRFIDIYESLPSFALVTVFCLFFQNLLSDFPTLFRALLTLTLAIALSHWMNSARIIGAKIQKILAEPYVEGAVALGAHRWHVFKCHIFPALNQEMKTLLMVLFPMAVMYESFMSFVGLGIPSPMTSWGSLIEESWSSISVYPHLLFFPGLFLFLTLYCAGQLDFRSK